MSIEDPEDREEYLSGMLDPNLNESFFEELRSLQTRKNPPPDMFAYKKSVNHEAVGGARPKSGAVPKGRHQVNKITRQLKCYSLTLLLLTLLL